MLLLAPISSAQTDNIYYPGCKLFLKKPKPLSSETTTVFLMRTVPWKIGRARSLHLRLLQTAGLFNQYLNVKRLQFLRKLIKCVIEHRWFWHGRWSIIYIGAVVDT